MGGTRASERARETHVDVDVDVGLGGTKQPSLYIRGNMFLRHGAVLLRAAWNRTRGVGLFKVLQLFLFVVSFT